MRATYSVLGTPVRICCIWCVVIYLESNSVLVADDDTTSAVSPTRREAPPKDIWNAKSPTKLVCLP